MVHNSTFFMGVNPIRKNTTAWHKTLGLNDWTPTNLHPHRDLVRRVSRAVRRAGYPVVLTERMGIATNSHQCGTAVAGADPATSVLTADCRSHDVDNLYVVDSSFFPSSAAINPALTIAANARIDHPAASKI